MIYNHICLDETLQLHECWAQINMVLIAASHPDRLRWDMSILIIKELQVTSTIQLRLHNMQTSIRHQSQLAEQAYVSIYKQISKGNWKEHKMLKVPATCRHWECHRKPGHSLDLKTGNLTTLYCTGWSSTDWHDTRSPRPVGILRTWKSKSCHLCPCLLFTIVVVVVDIILGAFGSWSLK